MRSASIEVKKVDYVVANVATMSFDKASITVYGEVKTDNDIKNYIVAKTGADKQFIKITSVARDEELSGLYEITEEAYATYGKRVGDVRPKKEKEEKESK